VLELTEKYFDGKFDNVETKIKNVDDKLAKVIESVERIDGKVADHSVRLSIVEKSHKDHIEDHGKHENKRRFNTGQWIAVGLVIIAILSDKFL
jgi:hypothetical protein